MAALVGVYLQLKRVVETNQASTSHYWTFKTTVYSKTVRFSYKGGCVMRGRECNYFE